MGSRIGGALCAVLIGIVCVCTSPRAAAAPLGTAFTYQGRLQQNGAPLNGTVDLQFSIFDALSGGNQIGAIQTLDNVVVAGGLFTVTLNSANQFTAAGFNGQARWLKIAVRAGTSTGAYTALTPRQPLPAVPYALHAAGPFVTTTTGLVYRAGNVAINTTNPRHSLALGSGKNWTSNFWGGALELANANAIGWRSNGTSSFGIGQTNGGMYLFRTTSEPGTTATAATYLAVAGDNGRILIGTGSPESGSQLRVIAAQSGINGVRSTASGGTGVHADGNIGVLGSGSTYGVYGSGPSGVYGSGSTYGVRADGPTGLYATASGGWGVAGSSSVSIGVHGASTGAVTGGVYGTSPYIGVQGIATGGDGNRQGVRGEVTGSGGYAGLFQGGSTWVVGTLIKNAGSFKIDHPLDPANKTLSHSFVESPDMMNIYNGNVTTDARGYAVVELPSYFEALNKDFRYQLTVLDEADGAEFVQAKVTKPVQGNRFTLRTSAPATQVSWQVTGIRKDAWAEAHRIVVEEDKAVGDRGKYINPREQGAGTGKQIEALSAVPVGASTEVAAQGEPATANGE